MSRFEALPTELILQIASLLPSESSIAALALTNRRFHAICSPYLYQYNVLYGNSSALEWAAQTGRMDILQKALDAGAPLSQRQISDRRLEEGPIISQFGHTGRRHFYDFKPHPISLAAENGHLHIVRYMIDRGVSPNTTTPEWWTLLSLAAIHGHTSLAEYLLHRGARQGIRSFVGHRPIWLAAFQGHTDIVEMLLSPTEQHPDEPDKEELMRDALFAAAYAGQVPVVRLLLTHGVQVNTFVEFGKTPLDIAATKGISELVSLLLAYGADPNLIPDQRRCPAPLTAAAIEGHEDVVQILVHGTANLLRTRALALAVEKGNRQIPEILLRNGAPPQYRPSEIPRPGEDYEGWLQPLLLAVKSGNLELVELLLEYGADVNVECSEQWTSQYGGGARRYDRVIFWAVGEYHEAMINLLLKGGADLEVTDMDGDPSLAYAVGGPEAIIRSLLDHGANPLTVDWNRKKRTTYRELHDAIEAWLQSPEGERYRYDNPWI